MGPTITSPMASPAHWTKCASTSFSAATVLTTASNPNDPPVRDTSHASQTLSGRIGLAADLRATPRGVRAPVTCATNGTPNCGRRSRVYPAGCDPSRPTRRGGPPLAEPGNPHLRRTASAARPRPPRRRVMGQPRGGGGSFAIGCGTAMTRGAAKQHT